MGKKWNVSITYCLPTGLDPKEWKVEVRDGDLSAQIEWGKKPVIYLQLLHLGAL